MRKPTIPVVRTCYAVRDLETDDMKTLLVTIALAIARQAIQSNQNTFNNNPIFNHQPGQLAT